MKKDITFLISILIVAFCLFFMQFNTTKNSPKLAELKTNTYQYYYDISEANIIDFIIRDSQVYYLSKQDSSYTISLLDLFTDERTYISDFTYENCALKQDLITCSNPESTVIYDLTGKMLLNLNENIPVIPYKDTYLKLTDNKLYLTNQDYSLKDFSSPLTDYIDYFKTNNNTYLLFQNLEDGCYYLYNINERVYETITLNNYTSTSEGFIFYNEDTYLIYNLNSNTKKEYSNKQKKLPKIITSNNNQLLTFNESTSIIEIIDLKNDIIREVKFKDLMSMEVQNNYIYAHTNQGLYLIDMKSLNTLSLTSKEYDKRTLENISNNISAMATNYNINIYLKNNSNIEFPDFTAESITDYSNIMSTLSRLDFILQKFPTEVYESFYTNNFTGLSLYLTGKLTPNDPTTQASNPSAYSLTYDNKYMIVIDITKSNIEELICHELMHNIEFSLINNNITPFPKWNDLNPSDFTYLNSYTKPIIYNYTLKEEDSNLIYFVDAYSHTYAEEDRSRIFEPICSCNANFDIKSYPNLYQKSLYLKESLLNYYPSLNNTDLFKYLN